MGFSKMKQLIILGLILVVAFAHTNEQFHGNGTVQCFGKMVVVLDKPRPGSREGLGTLSCLPWFSPTVAPQGFIIDGDDNSHWVIVDDNGDAHCRGEVQWHTGDWGFGYCPHDTTLLEQSGDPFCGGATCLGAINATCHDMFMGCHGPNPPKTTTIQTP